MQLLKEHRKLLWCHNPKPIYENDDDKWDKYYIAARTLALLRPGIDKIILPGKNRQLKDFYDFCKKILGYRDDQVLWTSGTNYLMDKDIKIELLPQLKQITQVGKWRIISYSVTDAFNTWARELNVPFFGDNEDWVEKYSDKSILHPSITNPEALSLLNQFVKGVQVPRGYSCVNQEQLAAAYTRLRDEGVAGNIMLKAAFGSTGVGIEEIASEQDFKDYRFPLGAVVLEEKVIIDRDSDDLIMAPSVQYIRQELFPGVTDQIINGVTFAGNVFPSQISKETQAEIFNAANAVLGWLKPKGSGGMDFLLSGGRPLLIDPNIGRFTGAHPTRIFQSMYAPGTCFVCWKVDPKKPIFEFWQTLQEKGLAFLPGRGKRRGIFPLCYLEGMWGMLVAIGSSPAETEELKIQAEGCL